MGTLAPQSQGPESRCRVGVCLAPQGRGRAHLQQREVGQKARVQLFHIVEKFNQVDVSPAQLVAHQVVLSVALQHLGNGGVRSGMQVLAGWTPVPPLPLPCPSPSPTCPSAPRWAGGNLRLSAPSNSGTGQAGSCCSLLIPSGRQTTISFSCPLLAVAALLLLPRGQGLSTVCTVFLWTAHPQVCSPELRNVTLHPSLSVLLSLILGQCLHLHDSLLPP